MGASKNEFIEQREYEAQEIEVQKKPLNHKDLLSLVEQEKLTPLEAYAMLKDLETEFKKVKDIISCMALEDAVNYENTFTFKNFKFEKRSGRASYDFKNLPQWNEKKEELKTIEDLSKQAYSNYKKGLKVDIIDENGEVVQLPKVTYSSDVLIVKSNK